MNDNTATLLRRHAREQNHTTHVRQLLQRAAAELAECHTIIIRQRQIIAAYKLDAATKEDEA